MLGWLINSLMIAAMFVAAAYIVDRLYDNLVGSKPNMVELFLGVGTVVAIFLLLGTLVR